MSDDQRFLDQKKKESRTKKAVLAGAGVCILLAFLFMPKTVDIRFIDVADGYTWVDVEYNAPAGENLFGQNHILTIDGVKCENDHCFYAQAFWEKAKQYCVEHPIENCEKTMMDVINEGNFRQQAAELDLTMEDRISDVCFDNSKNAFCKSPKDLEDHLTERGIMKG